MNPIVVVKVGGSLLGWDRLPSRLLEVLDLFPNARLVLVCGGGEVVEAIRRLDRIHSIGEDGSHALAIAALDVTAQALAMLVPRLEYVDHLDSIADRWDLGQIPVLGPAQFLRDDDRSADALPHSWSVTSDSIAARLADRVGAVSLVLLKSAPLPASVDRAEAARLGLVDPAFPASSRGIGLVLYIDLRAASIESRRLD